MKNIDQIWENSCIISNLHKYETKLQSNTKYSVALIQQDQTLILFLQ